MIHRILKNQRGAGILVAVAVLAVLVGGLVISTQLAFDNTVLEVTKQRDRIASLQVLQDFAVLAQKANEVFVRGGNACPPAPWQEAPAGFCWQGPFPNTNNCVRNPIGTGNICIAFPQPAAPGAPAITVAQLSLIPVYDSYFDEMRAKVADIVNFREQIVAELQRKTLSLFDHQAYAISPEPHLPDDAVPVGPAELTINEMGCGPANPFGQVNCKVCGLANVICIELRACISTIGCRDINNVNFRDWYRQRVAILPR